MALLNKEQIFSCNDTKTEIVHVPEWGGDVKIASMSGHAKDKFEASVVGKNGGMNTANLRAKLVAASVVDDNGELLFTETDVHKLGKKSAAALDRIFAAVQKLNAMGEDEIDELAKN